MLKIQTFTIGPLETNCYLVYDSKRKEAILIDPAVYDKKIADYIKDINLQVKYTVNTHGHYDHMGANKDFGYPVLIHKKDEECLRDPAKNLGFIPNEEIEDSKGNLLKINLLGKINKVNVIRPQFQIKLDEIEKFEKRYLPAKDFGVIIISTNKGLMTHTEAKEKQIGGKLIAYCY